MLNSQDIRNASDLIWRHWQEGTRLPALPPNLLPATREEGYAIQALFEGRGVGDLFGWKIAATSEAGQKHINVDGPLGGRLLGERVYRDGATLPFGGNAMRVAEPEFAFRLGRDLPPTGRPYSVEEALEAVDALHPAIEVPDSRFEDFTLVGAAQLVADNACAHQFVLGPPAPESWRAMDLVQHTATIAIDGGASHDGVGANVLGDPRVALAWLINEVSGLGITLRDGQVITTGTCATPIPIAPGDHVRADFGELGRVSLAFAGE